MEIINKNVNINAWFFFEFYTYANQIGPKSKNNLHILDYIVCTNISYVQIVFPLCICIKKTLRCEKSERHLQLFKKRSSVWNLWISTNNQSKATARWWEILNQVARDLQHRLNFSKRKKNHKI